MASPSRSGAAAGSAQSPAPGRSSRDVRAYPASPARGSRSEPSASASRRGASELASRRGASEIVSRRGAHDRDRESQHAARKRNRAKDKADRAFSRQYGGLNEPADAAQSGPRAAVYKGEMGAKHRKAARMQNGAGMAPSAKRGARGRLASLKSSPRFIASAAVAVCLALSCVFLYPAAQQYYQAIREHDRLEAEYEAVSARTQAIEGDVQSLQTDAGVEDIAHAQLGWVKEGEQTANVRGLDLPEEGFTLRANIQPGSIEAPDTWYSPFLDPLFGVE